MRITIIRAFICMLFAIASYKETDWTAKH